MTEINVKGGCLCGKVTYECEAEPFVTLVCHCKACQRASGGPHVALAFVPREELEIKGELKTFSIQGNSGMMTDRQFCPECGSTVLGIPGALPQFVAICTGSLDDSSWVKPDLHCWTESKQDWDKLDPAELNFERAPDFKRARR